MGNVFELLFNMIGTLTTPFLSGQLCHVLKSWYLGGGPQGTRNHSSPLKAKLQGIMEIYLMNDKMVKMYKTGY